MQRTLISPSEKMECSVGITDTANVCCIADVLFIIADSISDKILIKPGIKYFCPKDFNKEVFLNELTCTLQKDDALRKLSSRLQEEKKTTRVLETKVKSYEKSLKEAGELQKDVMSKSKVPGFDISVYYQAQSVVSGDIFLMEDMGSHVFIAIGDVTDHGYFSGLYGAALYSLAKGYLYMASKFELDVKLWAKFLMDTSGIFQGGYTSYMEKESASVLLCEINKQKKKARFISLGHGNLPPVLIQKDSARFAWDMDAAQDHLPPVGTFVQKQITLDDKIVEVPFEKGMALLFYTDGATEVFKTAKNKNTLEEYSAGRLLGSVTHEAKKTGWTTDSVLEGVKRDISGYCISKKLDTKFEHHLGSIEDDITLSCIKWREECQ